MPAYGTIADRRRAQRPAPRARSPALTRAAFRRGGCQIVSPSPAPGASLWTALAAGRSSGAFARIQPTLALPLFHSQACRASVPLCFLPVALNLRRGKLQRPGKPFSMSKPASPLTLTLPPKICQNPNKSGARQASSSLMFFVRPGPAQGRYSNPFLAWFPFATLPFECIHLTARCLPAAIHPHQSTILFPSLSFESLDLPACLGRITAQF